MKIKKIILNILLICIVGSIITACSSISEKKILGRWDGTEYVKYGLKNYTYSYVFYNNGNYDQYKNEEGKEKENYYTSGHGTWSMVDKNHLRIEDYAVGSTVFEFEFDGDNLVLDGELFTKGDL